MKYVGLKNDGTIVNLGNHAIFDDAEDAADEECGIIWIADEQTALDWVKSLTNILMWSPIPPKS